MSRFFFTSDETGAGPTPGHWPPPRPYPPSPANPHATGGQPPNPMGGCWSKDGDYTANMLMVVPTTPYKTYRRGNFQLRVPGFTNGYNDKDRSILMTWELTWLTEADQQLCLNYYASIGLTHCLHSIPQTKRMGKGLTEFKATLQRARAVNQFNVVNVLGGDGESFTRDVVPWLDACEGLIDEYCVAWQIDAGDKVDEGGWYYTQVIPELTEKVAAYAKPRNVLVSQHWINGSCAMWPDYPGQPGSEQYAARGITNRFSYGDWAADYVDCQYLQFNTEASVDDGQSAAAKVLEGLRGGTQLCYAEGEVQAQAGYAGQPYNYEGREAYARQKGYIVACATRNGRFMDGGYFDQTCLPNGGVL